MHCLGAAFNGSAGAMSMAIWSKRRGGDGGGDSLERCGLAASMAESSSGGGTATSSTEAKTEPAAEDIDEEEKAMQEALALSLQ